MKAFTQKTALFLGLLIYVLVAPFSAQGQETETASQSIQFQHLFDDTFSPERVRSVNWMNDGRYFTAIDAIKEGVELRKYDITTGDYEVLLSSQDLVPEGQEQPIALQGYQFSADETKLLIKTDVEQIWRRSTREHYYVYDLKSGELNKLTNSDEKQQYAEFSPAGDKVAFVRNNDLFWVDLDSGRETQITSDGEENKIINGASDWVYEEEFSFAKAWFWAPDGNRIAFYRFDESRVKQYSFPEYHGGNYTDHVTYKYPKAGEQNSIVTIGVYDLDQAETTWMDIGDEIDQYIVRLNWTQDPHRVAIRRMNRLQNKQDLMIADASTGETEIIKTETSDTWIDENDDLTFLENGKEFIYVSEEDGYNHIYLYGMDGKQKRQVTEGDWEVTQFLGYDEDSKRIYYISTEDSPLERHLYSIKINGRRKKELGEASGWYDINMSPDFRYYIETFSAPNTPPIYTLRDQDGDEIRVLEDNQALADRLQEYAMPHKEYLQLDLKEAGSLNAYIYKPADFDSTKQYPVLMYVYGGPGSQTVTKRFDSGQRAMWHRYLVSKGYLVVSVDNRGTGARGRDFEKQTYKQLGLLETTDQIEAAKYFGTLPYVNEDRIGIWGWSYGGYMTTFSMEKGNDVFSTGIAVAPVTHWKFYDTIYTERFMQTPQLNPDGYRRTAPLNYADQITGDFLLIHGTSDDNVHFQNTVELTKQLIQSNVEYQTLIYPNSNHGIYTGGARPHLWRNMTEFILNHL
jgi:dipeptidyl-peptidase-4